MPVCPNNITPSLYLRVHPLYSFSDCVNQLRVLTNAGCRRVYPTDEGLEVTLSSITLIISPRQKRNGEISRLLRCRIVGFGFQVSLHLSLQTGTLGRVMQASFSLSYSPSAFQKCGTLSATSVTKHVCRGFARSASQIPIGRHAPKFNSTPTGQKGLRQVRGLLGVGIQQVVL